MNRSTIRAALLLSALALAVIAPAALASGTSYSPPATATTSDPMLVTKSMKCRVLELGPEGQLKIQDPKTEEVSWIKVTEDTNLRAQDKKAFDGRKKLDLSDLRVGHLLRISHRPHTGEVLKIKVLRDRKS